MARGGPGTPLRLAPDDFEVRRTEETTVISTVLLLDMSRSMLLRGCSTAAKRVAMALHTLIHTKYPRDRLYVVGFAYYARQIKPEAIATLSPYEFEYGTNLQHALMIARQLLGPAQRRQQGDRGHHRRRADGAHRQRAGRVRLPAHHPHHAVDLARGWPGDEGGDRDQHLHAGAIPLPLRVRRPHEPHQPRPRLLRRAGAPGRVRAGRLRQQARRKRVAVGMAMAAAGRRAAPGGRVRGLAGRSCARWRAPQRTSAWTRSGSATTCSTAAGGRAAARSVGGLDDARRHRRRDRARRSSVRWWRRPASTTRPCSPRRPRPWTRSAAGG